MKAIRNDDLIGKDYDPFGMLLSGRNWSAGSEYRYGFQGQEVENNIHVDADEYLFEKRVQDPRLGRFLSLDPMERNYPHNSPYAFCENRVIDGIDLEGSEYITYLVTIYGGGTGGTVEKIADYRGAADFDYNMFSESFGPEGRGVKYIYQYADDAGNVYATSVEWEMKQDGIASELGNHGLYMGAGCVTSVGPLYYDPTAIGHSYDWSQPPIDGVDAVTKTHDIAAGEIGEYKGWLEDTRTLPSDKQLVKGFDEYYETHASRTSAEVKGEVIDPYTKRPASLEAIMSAKTGSIFFNIVITYKEWKVETMQSMGLDPDCAEDQDKVTLEDYKGKWFQVSRNIQYKILKSATSQTSE